jgi:acetyltransferase-like isoleucine patch superfamily enzyme
MRTKIKNIIKSNKLLYVVVINIKYLLSRLFNIFHYGYLLDNKGICYRVKIVVIGERNKIIIGKNSIIRNTMIYIYGNNNIVEIKNNVIISGGELWIEDNRNRILLENYVSIEHAHIAITGNEKEIIIGEDSMLSNQITLRTGDSHAIINELGEKINYEQNIYIGKHVWLGNGVTVLKGVHIGDNSVIGTKAVVTKNIPASVIAVGIPATILKTNINWDRKRMLTDN